MAGGALPGVHYTARFSPLASLKHVLLILHHFTNVVSLAVQPALVQHIVHKFPRQAVEGRKERHADDHAHKTDQVAAAALYSVDKDYFAATRDEYKRRRHTMVEQLSSIPCVIYALPKGAFYIMAALPVDDADKFQLWLLNEFDDNGETVMFSCGEPFYGTPGKGKSEVRMAYVLKQEDLARAMDILAVAIKKYNETH